MKNLYELFVGFRYLKARKKQRFISFNTFLSIFIVFLGVFILILVLSVMSGFQSQIKDKILDVDSHITVSPYYGIGENGMKNYLQLAKQIENIAGVKNVEPLIQGQGLFRYRNNIEAIMIRGMGDTNSLPQNMEKFIVAEKHTPPAVHLADGEIIAASKKMEETPLVKKFTGGPEVFIGSEMALNYNISVGDYIELIVPEGSLNYQEGVTPGVGRFKVIGFFKTGYYEYDTSLVIMSLKESQSLFHLKNRVWGLGVNVEDLYQLDKVAKILASQIDFSYRIMTAEEKNQNLFYALKLEKLIMTIILSLVIVSAAFTIMGTLVMVVMDKSKDIGVLKALGAKSSSIMTIFVLEGFIIGLIGSLLGTLVGLLTAINLEAILMWVESTFNKIMFFVYDLFNLGIFSEVEIIPRNIYYIDSLPTQIIPEYVVIVAVFAVFVSTLAAIFPSWHAAHLKPVETIRSE